MLTHEEAQELHGRIGAALFNLNQMPARYFVASVKAELDPILERALELAALLVADTEGVEAPTPDTSINVYLTGDEDGPDMFGIIYDTEDEVLEVAHENGAHGWRVPVQPLLERAERLDGDSDA